MKNGSKATKKSDKNSGSSKPKKSNGERKEKLPPHPAVLLSKEETVSILRSRRGAMLRISENMKPPIRSNGVYQWAAGKQGSKRIAAAAEALALGFLKEDDPARWRKLTGKKA